MTDLQKQSNTKELPEGYITGKQGHRIYWDMVFVLTLIIMTIYVLNVNEKWSRIEYLWAGVLVGFATLTFFFILEIFAIFLFRVFTAIANVIGYIFNKLHRLIFPGWYKDSSDQGVANKNNQKK